MKSGLEFFPLDVTLDTKFELIEAEFGLEGFAVIVKLFQMIYGQEGYYGEVNDEVVLLFSRRCGVGGNTVSEIISAAVRRGIFDKTMYDRYKILTSAGIQKRYFDACKRREKVEVNKRYLLGDVYQNYKNVYISEKNVNNSEENVYSSEQSKESRVKESKVKREVAHKYGEYFNVLLTDSELQKWKSECPAWSYYIERLSSWMESSGKHYKSHLATMRNWYRDDQEKQQKKESDKKDKEKSYDLDKFKSEAMKSKPEYRRKNDERK